MAAQEKRNEASPETLQLIINNPNAPHNKLFMRHLQKGGMLAPLGKLLGQLLQDPILKQTMESNAPLDKDKFN